MTYTLKDVVLSRLVLKRRIFVALGVGGAATAVASRYAPPLFSLPLLKDAACSNPSSAASDAPFRFVTAGDVGTGGKGQRRVADAMAAHWCADPFQTVLLLGDNIYENGEISRIAEVFEQPYAELLQKDVTFHAVLGNHDFRTRQGEDEIAYPGYNMPDRYYTFTKGPAQFFALDTNQFYLDSDQNREALWSAQHQWLKTELERSSAQWKIVFAHHPIYSSGRHGTDGELAASLSPLFEEYGVHLYINGHEHSYERTQPINGTIYINAGNGGRSVRKVGESEWTEYAKSRLGFTTFDVYNDRIVVKAIGTNGRTFDESLIPATVAVS